MYFRTVKSSIVNNVLGPAEAGRFQTVGFQRQAKSADEVLDESRMVQVYYSAGDISKQGGRLTGPVQHDITYRVDMTVAKAAEGDLSLINNPAATAPQIAAALLAFQEASDLADDSLDELFDAVYQILMDARNYDMGMSKGVVANRWVDQIQKDQPVPRGEYVVLTGSMLLKLRVVEQITGDTGTPGTDYDVVVDLEGDDIEKTGVAGTLGG